MSAVSLLLVALVVVASATTAKANEPVPFGGHFGLENMKPVTVYTELPTPEVFYKEHLKGNKPAVVKGAAHNWPALQKWKNLTYLIEASWKNGNNEFEVMYKNFYEYDKHHYANVRMEMEEFVDRLKRNENVYMDDQLPGGVLQDVIYPKFLACDWWLKQMTGVQIFFNRGQSSTDAHVDNTETMFAQVLGRRQWILNPRNDSANLYARSEDFPYHQEKSRIEPLNASLEENPNMMKADYYLAVAEVGDLVYCPESWFHQVKALDNPNIAVAIYHKVLRCENAESEDRAEECERKRKLLPDDIKCSEPPEADMLPLDQLARKHPKTEGLSPFCVEKGCFRSAARIEEMKNLEKLNIGPFCKEVVGGAVKRITNVKGQKVSVHMLGLSFYGMKAEVLKNKNEIESILKVAYKSCAWSFIVSEKDGSVDAFVDAGKAIGLGKNRVKKLRAILVIRLEDLWLKEDPAAALRESVMISKQKLTHVVVLMLEAPYCSFSEDAGFNNTKSCHRVPKFEDWQKWKLVWTEARKLWTERLVYGLGVKDVSVTELTDLLTLEKIAGQPALQILQIRVDPFYRNLEIRLLAERNNLHVMAHGLLGSFYPKTDPNPLTTSLPLKLHAFSSHGTVYSAAVVWAMINDMMVMPRVRDVLELRFLMWSWQLIDTEESKHANYREMIEEMVDENDIFHPMMPEEVRLKPFPKTNKIDEL